MSEFKESEHPRDAKGRFAVKGKQAKRKAILDLLRKKRARMSSKLSGGISGALNSDSKRAKRHAKKYYAFLRKIKSDVPKIAKNTGYSIKLIQKIKNYLFIDSHNLEDGYHPFHPDYNIAVSWQRLFSGKGIKESDIVLLKHEMLEMKYRNMGYNQREAHDLTNKKYNYKKMLLLEKQNGNNKKHKKK